MLSNDRPITIAGAGPVGALLATILAQRGLDVTLFEKRPDLRRAERRGGRSINLVLTDRGLRALDLVDLRAPILQLTVPVLGRMMHNLIDDAPGTSLAYQPYGVDDSQCNYSISRDGLNAALLDAAEAAGANIHFQTPIHDVCFDENLLYFDSDAPPAPFDLLFGCDGAPSAVRRAMVRRGLATEDVQMMHWGYKELLFPAPSSNDDPSLAGHALHIWPRGHHFLMGLANLDGSFTGTAYLPRGGRDSFANLHSPEAVRTFFLQYYPDAVDLLGDFVDSFLQSPIGNLGTVRTTPWHVDDRCLLLGDASHGIVPFFGQGLNAGFEDCTLLVQALQSGDDLEATFAAFSRRRKPDADAIADMALENFVEMSDKVADPHFLLKKKVESLLERTFPDRYRSRYAHVMYSHIPYAQAQKLGVRQEEILTTLTQGITSPDEVDLHLARRLVDTLQPID